VYAEFLSEGANPPAGEPRRLTSDDCALLRAVNQLRANGFEPQQIADRLRADPTGTVQDPIEPLPHPDVSVLATVTAPSSADALAVFVTAADARLTNVAARVESLDRRLAASESNRRLIIAVVLAFAAGGVLVGVIAWLFILLR
jgi:DNA-binding transcriptional MerR regulator